EACGVEEETVNGADRHDARAGPGAGTGGSSADLAEALDRNGRSFEAPSEVSERGTGGRLDAVTCRQVVHSEPLVALRPEGQVLDEVWRDEGGRPGAHVRAGPGG